MGKQKISAKELLKGTWQQARYEAACDALTHLTFPNKRSPGWQHTPIERMIFQNSAISSFGDTITHTKLDSAEDKAVAIEITSKEIRMAKSAEISEKDVFLGDFSAIEILPIEYRNTYIQTIDNHYLAHSVQGGTQGFFVYIKPSTNIPLPITIDVISDQPQAIKTLSWLILAGSHSRAEVSIRWHSLDSKIHADLLTNGMLILEDGANLDILECQMINQASWMYSNMQTWVNQNAKLNMTSVAIGGTVSKSDLHLNMVGQGSEAMITGLYQAEGDQFFNFDTHQNHSASRSKSDLLFKGALDNKSRAVWRGMINVEQETVAVDGFQAHRVLLLEDGTRSISLPGLEISTEDVRCSHAVAAGSIDDDQMFYLRTRGIPAKEAEIMILNGFFEAALARIRSETLRQQASNYLNIKID